MFDLLICVAFVNIGFISCNECDGLQQVVYTIITK